MTRQLSNQTQQQTSTTSPLSSGILQRKCASCGQHTIAGGECAECQKQRSPLQRRSANQAEPSEVPPIVGEVLRSPGQPLGPETCTFIESRFDYDFSQVPLHQTRPDLAQLPLAVEPLLGNSNSQTAVDRVQEKAAAARTLENFTPDKSLIDRWRAQSKAFLLPGHFMNVWSSESGVSIPPVNIHNDRFGDLVAMAHNAEAVTIHNDIYLREDAQTPGLLAHELAHVAQSVLPGAHAPHSEREQEASRVQQSFLKGEPISVRLSGSSTEPMRHPAVRILLRAGRWLLTRTTRTISKHIARHARRIAGRAVHSIFRNPREVRTLVSRTVQEATQIARNAATHGADDVLEQGGVRIFRQASRTPGKYRFVVEKDFGRAIGTLGERILRIVLDMSGRVVTAFPVDRFLAVGLAFGAVNIFEERTAEASERIRARIEAEENQPTDWVGEIIDFLNPLSGGTLNEGEDLMLDVDRIVDETTYNVIREIEESEQMTLSMEQRNAITDLVRVGLGSPMELEQVEED